MVRTEGVLAKVMDKGTHGSVLLQPYEGAEMWVSVWNNKDPAKPQLYTLLKQGVWKQDSDVVVDWFPSADKKWKNAMNIQGADGAAMAVVDEQVKDVMQSPVVQELFKQSWTPTGKDVNIQRQVFLKIAAEFVLRSDKEMSAEDLSKVLVERAKMIERACAGWI